MKETNKYTCPHCENSEESFYLIERSVREVEPTEHQNGDVTLHFVEKRSYDPDILYCGECGKELSIEFTY